MFCSAPLRRSQIVELLFAIVLLGAGGIGVIIQHRNKIADQERKIRLENDRRNEMASKYAGDAHKDDVVNGVIRPGMSVRQLVDAWGPPAAIDERVLKTKVVHTYKYAQTGKNSFRQKVKIENG